jgi:Fe-S-cluster containining protein
VAAVTERRDSVQGSLGCAGSACGDCCERISIGSTLADIRSQMSTSGANVPPEAGRRGLRFRFGGRVGAHAREAAFILRHWHPTGDVVRSGNRVKQVLSCDQFDPVHRTCMAHDDRPPVCSGFPFYGQEPHGAFRESHCSYLLDVPPADRPEGSRPLIPLEIIRAT